MKFTPYVFLGLCLFFAWGLVFKVGKRSCDDCVCSSNIDEYCYDLCHDDIQDDFDYPYCITSCKLVNLCDDYMNCDKCGCIISGCNGEVCLDKPVVTRCEWICEYGCYKYAKCDKVDGLCQWIPQEGYDECIQDCEEQ